MNAKRTCAALCWTVILMTTASCDWSEKPKRSREPVSFAQLKYPDLVAAADGGMYVIASREVWYMQGDTAKKVTGLPVGGDWPEITPSADGGAYATISTRGIWRLDKDSATQVHEVATLSNSKSERTREERERALFVLWQHERSQRKSLQELEDARHEVER